jgi:hypothetical protein
VRHAFRLLLLLHGTAIAHTWHRTAILLAFSGTELDLQSVLGSTLQSSCPLAGSSAFYVDTSLLPASSDESAPSPTRGSVTRHNASVLADTFHLQVRDSPAAVPFSCVSLERLR